MIQFMRIQCGFASVEYVKLDSLILKLFIKWVTSMCPNLKIGWNFIRPKWSVKCRLKPAYHIWVCHPLVRIWRSLMIHVFQNFLYFSAWFRTRLQNDIYLKISSTLPMLVNTDQVFFLGISSLAGYFHQ